MKRRNFLKSAAGASLALPALSSLAPRAARAQSNAPKRILILFSPNGTAYEHWAPDPDAGGISVVFERTEVNTDFDFSHVLQPLQPYQSDLCIVEGLEQKSTSQGPGDGHQKGMGHMLTGTALQEGALFEGGNGEPAGWAGGISIDQHIANTVGTTTRFSSLELGAQVSGANVWSRMSYRAAGEPIPPESNPYEAFERLFGELSQTPQEVLRRRARRRSVLDFVLDEFNALMPTLPASDRPKVEQHFDAIREIESRLGIGSNANCAAPLMPDGSVDIMANDNYPLVCQTQMDIAAQAFACDLTRVASIQFSNAVGNIRHTWQGITRGHHEISHGSTGQDRQEIGDINRWYAEQMAYVINKLKTTPDVDGGNLLDNTVIFWTNELGDGQTHARRTMPYVLAGSCGGTIQTGRHIRYPDADGDVGNFLRPRTPHNNLLLTLARAMGLNDSSFGNGQFCDGVLDEVLV